MINNLWESKTEELIGVNNLLKCILERMPRALWALFLFGLGLGWLDASFFGCYKL